MRSSALVWAVDRISSSVNSPLAAASTAALMLSRAHAQLERVGGRWMLEEAGDGVGEGGEGPNQGAGRPAPAALLHARTAVPDDEPLLPAGAA